jgi:hypothetical protein
VSTYDAKQLVVDIGVLDGCAIGPCTRQWRAQTTRSKAADACDTGRIDQVKRRANLALQRIGFQIADERGRGRWQLLDGLDHGRHLELEGGVWNLDRLASCSPAIQPGLTEQQARVWRVLAAAHPRRVSLHALAGALDKAPNEQGLHQTADAIHKLERALQTQDAPWRVVRPQRGLYGIAPAKGRGDVQ